jgi:hypothetical protein
MCKDAASHVVIHHVQEIRTGGRYLIEVRDPAKSETYWGQGVYLEVKPPEKIVFSWAWTKAEPDGSRTELHPDSPDTKVTVEFFARGDFTIRGAEADWNKRALPMERETLKTPWQAEPIVVLCLCVCCSCIAFGCVKRSQGQTCGLFLRLRAAVTLKRGSDFEAPNSSI